MYMKQQINIDEVKSDAMLPTEQGNFRIRVFVDSKGAEHSVLSIGLDDTSKSPLVRIHSECLTGDAFGSLKCDCGPQLESALKTIVSHGWGCLLYLRQEGRGIGLHAKIQAYHLQDQGADTLDANLMLGLPADGRDYSIAASMLASLGVPRVNLLSNNPNKQEQLENHGIEVAERIPLVVGVGEQNRFYLETKVERMGHEIDQDKLV